MLLRNWLDGFLSRFSRVSLRRYRRRSGRVLKHRKAALRSPEALEVRTLLSASSATFKLQTGAMNPLNGQDVGNASTLAIGDITGDGLPDVIAGSASGTFAYYTNTGTATNPAYTLQTGPANPLNGQFIGGWSFPTLGDLNGDGLLDLIAGRGDGTFVYFKNTGTASSPVFTQQIGAANPLNGQDVGQYSAPTLGDLTGDGLLDLIVGNQNGTFTYYKNTGTATSPVFTFQSGAANPLNGQDSGQYSAPTLGDLNGDGLLDLLVGDGNGTFSYYQNTGTAANPAFTPQTGAANPLNGQDVGIFSTPTLGDLNGDGRADLVSGNDDGLFAYYMNVGPFRPTLERQYGSANPLAGQNAGGWSSPTLGDLTGDGLIDLIATASDGSFKFYKNTGTPGTPVFTLQTGADNPLNGQTFGFNSVSTLGDLNGDGLLDLIVGTWDGTFAYYKNTGTATAPAFTRQTGGANPLDGQDIGDYAVPALGDLNGDGRLDLIVGDENGTFSFYKNTGTTTNPVFALQSGAANPMSGKDIGKYSAPTIGDLNGDGLQDLVVGDYYGQFSYFLNTGTATNPVFTRQINNWNPLNGQDLGDYSHPALGDVDGDGTLDLIAGNQAGNFLYYRNVPAPIVPRLVPQTGASNPLDGQDVGYTATPTTGDLNGDGLLDLISGKSDGTFLYYLNTGTRTAPVFTPQTGAANPLDGQDVGAYPTPALKDLTGDGLLDLIVGNKGGTFSYYKNTGTATTPAFTLQTGAADPLNGQNVGGYSAPTLGDLNGDGLVDLLVGNRYGVFSYYKNTGTAANPVFTLQTGAANPLDGQNNSFFATPSLKDLDGDGLTDLVVGNTFGSLSYYKNTGTTTVPVFTLQTGAADPFSGVNIGTYAAPSLQDLDGDGRPDLIAGVDSGVFRYFRSIPQTAPVLNPTIHPQVNIAEDVSNAANTGLSLADIITTTFGSDNWYDVDSGALQGIAIIAADTTLGNWQYSTDGGTIWTNIGSPTASSAFLLANDGNARVRFAPNANANGTIPDALTFVAWDQTSGNNLGTANASVRGGNTPFSTAAATINLTITPVNDAAPVLNPTGNPSLPSIPEDTFNNSGTSIKDLIASTALGNSYITDADPENPRGLALYSAPSSGGNWQYSLNNGGTWTTISGVSQTNALLLAADDAGNTRLRFVPLTNFNGTRKVYFRAWDQSSGANGGFANITTNGGTTPFSYKADSASITVTPVNDAPLLFNTYNPVVPTVNKSAINNPGFKVSAMIASTNPPPPNDYITDVDGGVEGIAIYSVQDVGGHWEYSLTNGTPGSWTSIGAVSPTNALLLKSDASTYLRFVPNNTTIGDRKIFFRAWDQSSGVAGTKVNASVTGTTTPFSVGADSLTLTVNTVNDAPVLNPAGSPTLPTISHTNTNPAGISILSLIASGGANYITDLESTDPQGIAIYGAPSSGGTWEYSLDTGAHWTSVGTVDQSHSLLLKALASTMIRFRPNGVFTGSRVLSFSAWDQSTGTEGTKVDTNYDGVTLFNRGGTTAFSIARDTAAISVT